MSDKESKAADGVDSLSVGGKMAASLTDAIYTSESRGSDEAGEGTYEVPYKTIMQAMRRCGKEPFPTLYQDPKPDSEAAKAGAGGGTIFFIAKPSVMFKIFVFFLKEKFTTWLPSLKSRR